VTPLTKVTTVTTSGSDERLISNFYDILSFAKNAIGRRNLLFVTATARTYILPPKKKRVRENCVTIAQGIPLWTRFVYGTQKEKNGPAYRSDASIDHRQFDSRPVQTAQAECGLNTVSNEFQMKSFALNGIHLISSPLRSIKVIIKTALCCHRLIPRSFQR
jgi:hypothetical protein